MRVLLDENPPRKLKQKFDEDTEVLTVQDQGWGGLKNGELLSLAQDEFDAFVTMDQGIEYQQNLQGVAIAVVVLHAPTSRIEDLRPLMAAVNEQLPTAKAGEITHIGE